MSKDTLRLQLGIGWRVSVVLLGLVILIITYYLVHKPLSISQAIVLGGVALDILTVSLVAASGGGIGRRLLQKFGGTLLKPFSRAERVALEGTLGLGLMGLGAMGLGLVGLYRGLILWAVLAAVSLLNLVHVIGWLRDLVGTARFASPRTPWERFLAAVGCILLFTGLLHAFAPAFAWDALAYHLVGPTRYLSTGQITADANNFFMGFPQGAELVYGIGISLFGRNTAAAPLHALYGLYGLLAVGGLLQRYANRRTAWLSVVLLLSAPSVWLQFGWPYIDLALLAYGACALAAISNWQGGRGSRFELVLAGSFAGLALGAKYTGGAILFAMAVYVLIMCRRDLRSCLRSEVTLVGAALILFVPWLVKGLLLYQNPVYPFGFSGLNWDSERTRAFTTAESGLLDSGYWWQIPFLPIAATILGVEKGAVLRGASFYFAAGPWLLIAPLILAPGWRWLDERSRALGLVCMGLAVPLLVFWVGMSILSPVGTQTRLMIVALPVIAAAGALGVDGLARWPCKPLDLSFMVRAMLCITLLLGLIQMLSDSRRAILFYLHSSPDAYLDDALGTHIGAMRRLAELPSGASVRLMWEPRSFYCPTHIVCLPDVVLDHWPYFLRQSGTPDRVFAQWRALERFP